MLWVDWREIDADIVRYRESVLQTGSLVARELSVPRERYELVHPPAAPADEMPWDWRFKVQVAAALVLSRAEERAGRDARSALLHLVWGPVDWTTTAAIIALLEVGRERHDRERGLGEAPSTHLARVLAGAGVDGGARGLTRCARMVGLPIVPNWKVPSRKMPRPPGDNPFRVKGHGLRARMAVYDRIVPGGSRAVLDAIDDPSVRSYLDRPLLASSWYDLFAHAYLDVVAAELRKMGASESVASASALQAQADARGIYAVLLKLVSPHTVVKKLGAISSQYFDHVTVRAEKLDAHAARLTAEGIANQLYWWWGGILDGYVHALFELAGAKNTQVYCGPLRTSAPDDPLGIGSFSVDVRWD